MSASRKAYGINSFFSKLPITQKSNDRVFPQAECENSFFQSYFEILYHQSIIQEQNLFLRQKNARTEAV